MTDDTNDAPPIDWSKPIETLRGHPARFLYPFDPTDVTFVEIESAHCPYNEDGTPVEGHWLYGPLRNVPEPEPPRTVEVPPLKDDQRAFLEQRLKTEPVDMTVVVGGPSKPVPRRE